MSNSIKIKLDTSQYKPPTQEDITSAKQFILRRNDYARILGDKVDDLLEDAAARIVTICYKYNISPKEFEISSRYNEPMMEEISTVMDELEEDIITLTYDYSSQVLDDSQKDRKTALLLWIASLGRGNRNFQDTLDGYLYKTMKDWEAAIAALRYANVQVAEAITKIKTNLHTIYTMPEVTTAFKDAEEFNATYIKSRGVNKGAVGLSNNGSTNVTNMAKLTLQMAWMREQGIEFDESGAEGYYVLRGSSYPCDLCDSMVGFHKMEDIDGYPPYHGHCCCYVIPIFPAETKVEETTSSTQDRREEYERYQQDPDYTDVEYNPQNGGLMATHILHNLDDRGGIYEKHVQRAGFNAGHAVILGAEGGNVIGQRFTEGTWDGMKFEVAGRETATSNNIVKGLKHCAAKRETEIAVLDFPNRGFNLSVLQNAILRYRGLELLNDGQYIRFKKIICVQDEVIVYEQDF